MMNAVDEIVRLENIWMQYNDIPVLEDINLAIGHDDFLGIIGPNGGGKTTLLKVMLGLVKPTEGQVIYPGYTINEGRKLVGYVPQYNLFDRAFPVSVWDVAIMGRHRLAGLFKRYGKEDRKATERALRMVGMLDSKNRQIGNLSGGQQQRVFIARAVFSCYTKSKSRICRRQTTETIV